MGKSDKPPFEVPGGLQEAAAPRLRPSKIEPFREYNEVTHSGACLGGQRDFDVPGQQTPLETGLHSDLLPGEQIVRQFDVNLYLDLSIFRKIMWTLCFLCRSCLSKPVYHDRRRVAITTHGRIGMFHSLLVGDQMGNVCFCIKGGLRCANHVEIRWFHASDISAAQFYKGEENGLCPPWRLVCPNPHEARVNVWFEKYPAVHQLHNGARFMGSGRTALPSERLSADVSRGLFKSLVTGAQGFIAHCFPGGCADEGGGGGGNPVANIFAMLPCAKLCSAAVGVDPRKSNPYFISIRSAVSGHYRDRLHPDKDEQEDSMRALYDAIMQVAAPAASGGSASGGAGAPEAKHVANGALSNFTGPDDGKPHFNIVNQPAVLLDRSGSGVPVVNVEQNMLLPGEQVVDAIPWQEHQSWFEFLSSFCNCCFFCPPSKNGAMILTSQRVITVFVKSRAAARGDGTNRKGNMGICASSFEYVIESLALGKKGFKEGLLGLGIQDSSLLIRTQFGGLTIRTELRNRYPWQCAVNRAIRTRGRLFLSNFVSRAARQVLATPPPGFNAGVPEDLQQVLPLMPGESFVATMRSEGLFLNLADHYNPCTAICTCGNDRALVRLVRMCTCGCKPLEHVAHVVLTTHRLLAVGFPENAPWFCKSWCTRASLVVFWQPLELMPGFKIDANLFVDQSCISRICACMPCFSPAEANLTVDSAGLRGFPVPIQRYLPQTNEGLLDEPQVNVIRRALSLVTASPGLDPKVNLGALPGAPPAAAAAGAGAGAPQVASVQNPVGGM